jgi:hypothetical protein
MRCDDEIIGLKDSNNGGLCQSYECCGENLSADDFICFRLCVSDFEDGRAEAIQAVQI